jgi:hypothetical protein
MKKLVAPFFISNPCLEHVGVALFSQIENRLKLHISQEKCNSHIKYVGVTHFLRKIQLVNRSELHISQKNCNSYQKHVGVAHFSRNVQLMLRTGRSCTFIEKSVICIKNRLELHISREKCNSCRDQVGVA